MDYRPDIQGLRAIAVLSVMVFHFDPLWLPGGFVGVDVFLVISGFLITSILLKKRSQPEYRLVSTLKYFYFSRAKRLAPAYYFLLLVVSVGAAIFFLPADYKVISESAKAAALFDSNRFFANFGDYFAPANHEQPLLHTWSLAVEVKFYIMAPFLILLVPRKLLKWLFSFLFLVFIAIAEYQLTYQGGEQEVYYSLYARLPEFLAGSLVAIYLSAGGKPARSQIIFGPLGIVLIGLSVIVQPGIGHFPGLNALLPVAGSVMILIGSSDSAIGKLLANSSLVWVGALSYSLYLWHWPVLAFLRYYTGLESLGVTYGLIFLAITLLLSVISFYLVEKPMRRNSVQKRRYFGFSIVALSGIIVASYSFSDISESFNALDLPEEYVRYADPATICHGKVVGECLQGEMASNHEVLVLGDSHAAMLNSYFGYLGTQLGFRARIITASSCVTIPGFDYERLPDWAQSSCVAQMKEAEKYIEDASVIFLAGMWSYQTQSDDFLSAFSTFLERFNGRAQVYVMPQVPMLNQSPLRNFHFKNLGLEGHVGIDEESIRANRLIGEIVSQYSSVRILGSEIESIFSNAPFFGNDLVYFDRSHLNEVGARIYGAESKETLQRVLGFY